MTAEWPVVNLKDHIDSCLGKMLDQEKNRGEFYPYLGNKNVRWGSFDLDDLPLMRFEENEHERYGLRYGDLVVCEGGEPGRCAIWQDQVPGMKIQKALHRIRPKPGLNNQYLFYWFSWAGRAGLLEPYFTGTTIKHLTGKAINLLKVPLPPLVDQEYIAHILGTLDDKIELNRQMNSTLESMAQALFKSWFVDFDPVIDNALAAGNRNAGPPIPDELQARAAKRQALGDKRKPLPKDIQQQFPDRFVFTEEMGWVPEGWKFGPISTLAKLNPESWTAKKHPVRVRYIDLANVKDGRVNEVIEYDFAEAPSRARRVLQLDDTIVGTVRPGNRSFAFVGVEGLTGSTGFAVMRPKDKAYRAFIYLALTQDETIRQFAHLADGAAYPAIRPDIVAGYELPIPTTTLLSEFDKLVFPWVTKIQENESSSIVLASMRDVLLPKLLSGELRIPDAEKQLAEVM